MHQLMQSLHESDSGIQKNSLKHRVAKRLLKGWLSDTYGFCDPHLHLSPAASPLNYSALLTLVSSPARPVLIMQTPSGDSWFSWFQNPRFWQPIKFKELHNWLKVLEPLYASGFYCTWFLLYFKCYRSTLWVAVSIFLYLHRTCHYFCIFSIRKFINFESIQMISNIILSMQLLYMYLVVSLNRSFKFLLDEHMVVPQV